MTDASEPPPAEPRGSPASSAGSPESDVFDLRTRLAEMEHRLQVAQQETAQTRERAARERLRFETELERHRKLLQERSQRLDRIRHDLDRIRGYRVVRLALAIRTRLRGPVAAGRRKWWALATRLATIRARITGRGSVRRASAGEEWQLIAALRAELRGAPQAGEERVTIAITVRHGGPPLARLLARLSETDRPVAAVVLLAPPALPDTPAVAAAIEVLEGRPGWSVTRQDGDLTRLVQLRGAAPEVWAADYAVFIHEDVEPFEPAWLTRLIAAQQDRDAGAVGARLIVARTSRGSSVSRGPAELTIDQLGWQFSMVDGMPRPCPSRAGDDPLTQAARQRASRPALDDACLLVPSDVLDELSAIPGEDPAMKVVEFCLQLWAMGRPVVCEGTAVLWHDHPIVPRTPVEPSEDPWQGVVDRWGPRLFREVFRDRISSERRWSADPLHVAITLTRNDQAAPYGDWYTAHELGDALANIGWRISYIERYQDRWYDLDPSVDVVIALLDLLDLSKLPRHIVTIAWVRNWTERWLSHPWFDDYDIVLASSQRSKELIEAGSAKVATLMPLATNPGRFKPQAGDPAMASDAAFVGSDWGEERGVASALPALAAAGRRVRVWGRNWEKDPRMAPLSGGVLDYERVPEAYASTKIVVDDTASPTRPYGAVNSRVFDALAAGAIVVSDNDMGVRELFDEDFPTWDSAESLQTVVDGLLGDSPRREALLARYRRVVLERHTYARRADEMRTALLGWTQARRIALHIGPQTWEMAARWGDTPFGRDAQRQLEKRGFPSVLVVFEERAAPIATRCDVAVHIFGVRAPETRQGQIRLLWVISHPDRVTAELCAGYDSIFVASDLFLEHLRARTSVPLYPLHQASDPDRFRPDPDGPVHELLFVGNSRGVHRPIIDDVAGTTRDLAVYGGLWTPELLDPKHLRGEWIPNDEVHAYYSGAAILLNDHWQDMRDEGFISNRLYDALASGAFIISDFVPGIEEEFDGGVVTYRRREELLAHVDRYLADPAARREVADRGRAAVLARHTFGHRMEALIAVAGPLLELQPAALATGPAPSRID